MPLMSKVFRGGEEGFYLPIDFTRHVGEVVRVGGLSADERLAVWMDYDREVESFLGAIKLGPVTCHVQAHRLHDLADEDPRGRFLIDNEEVDGFIGGMGEGDRPSTFQVEGYEGDWVVTVYPYC